MIDYRIVRQDHLNGDVFVSIWVTKDGKIIGTETIQYYFDEQFDNAINVRLQKYRDEYDDGEPVPFGWLPCPGTRQDGE